VAHNKWYIIGGYSRTREITDSVQCYDFVAKRSDTASYNKWITCAPLPKGAGYLATSCVVNDFIYLFGDWNVSELHLIPQSSTSRRQVMRYSIVDDEWTILPTMMMAPLTNGGGTYRGGPLAIPLTEVDNKDMNGVIALIGDGDNNNDHVVQLFDTNTLTFRSPSSLSSMPWSCPVTSRYSGAIMSWSTGVIVAIGESLSSIAHRGSSSLTLTAQQRRRRHNDGTGHVSDAKPLQCWLLRSSNQKWLPLPSFPPVNGELVAAFQ
jgi:hypothetical protein